MKQSLLTNLLVLLALALCGCGQGSDGTVESAETSRSDDARSSLEKPEELDGRWMMSREARMERVLTPEQLAEIEKLESIGYLSGSKPGHESVGVVVHAAEQSWSGVNLYLSGHAPEAILMDMDGKPLHRWQRSLAEALPGYDGPIDPEFSNCWRRARMLADGGIVAIFEGKGVFRLDRDSNLLWSNPNRAHHDLELMPSGQIVLLTRTAHLLPRVHPEKPTLEDFVVILDEDGNERSRLSILEAFENSEWISWYEQRRVKTGDIFHTNSIQVLSGRAVDAPWNQPGFFLLSVLSMDAVIVIDPFQRKVVQAWAGPWKEQHEPLLLPTGSMLLFDNKGESGRSRVLEFDPVDGEMIWQFQGYQGAPFYTSTCGTAQRLPNGNTLVVESDNGRALEVDVEGRTVWEFRNPARAGSEGEFVATLFDLIRLPAELADFAED